MEIVFLVMFYILRATGVKLSGLCSFFPTEMNPSRFARSNFVDKPFCSQAIDNRKISALVLRFASLSTIH